MPARSKLLKTTPPATQFENLVSTSDAKLIPPSKNLAPGFMPTFAQLDPQIANLIGPNARDSYDSMSVKKKMAFLNIISALNQVMDTKDLEIVSMKDDRILFSKSSIPFIVSRMDKLVEDGIFINAKPSSFWHKEMSLSGYREKIKNYSLQIGIGEDGAFADIDIHCPKYNRKQWWLHVKEMAGNLFFRRTTSPVNVGNALRARGVSLPYSLPQ